MGVSRRGAVAAMLAGVAGLPLTACAGREAAARRAGAGAPALPREFRAAWVASVDNIDWPSEPALSVERQRAEIDAILDLAQRLNLNAVLLQVRPTSDALYLSATEPWSAFLTGRQGTPPSPIYDPLIDWIAGAHRRGLGLHAWVNPFRVRHPVSIGPDAPGHVANRRPDLVRAYGPYLWLDPGEPEAREMALAVCADLLDRYDLDGVHMDDYFYPYPKDGKPFPDDASFARYRAAGGRLERDAWRRENIDGLIRALNDLTHARRPGAIFTVSPFGIWRPDHPPGVKGFDAYAGLHADSRRWIAEGWCDALMPQLYWPIASAGQPFEPLLEWWIAQRGAGRHVWPGLYLTRIKPEGAEEQSWAPSEILDQIGIVRRHAGAEGFALFSMVGMTENRRGVSDALARGPLRGPALTPRCVWAGGPAPAPPEATLDGTRLRVAAAAGEPPARRVAVRWRTSTRWSTRIEPTGLARTLEVPVAGAREVVVNAIGPNGRTSEPTRVVTG
jgi:uncharacterized lipoprotein YddW (UPF0748 family)